MNINKNSIILIFSIIFVFCVSSSLSLASPKQYTIPTCFEDGSCYDLTTYDTNALQNSSAFWSEICSLCNCTHKWPQFLQDVKFNTSLQNAGDFAIWMYTQYYIYKVINNELRDGFKDKNVSTDHSAIIFTLSAALNVWPKTKDPYNPYGLNTVFRTTYYDDDFNQAGVVINQPTFLSSTGLLTYALKLNRPYLYAIAHSSGRYMEPVSWNIGIDEVTFNPGLQFYVLKIELGVNNTKTVAYIYEYNEMTANFTLYDQTKLLHLLQKSVNSLAESGSHFPLKNLKRELTSVTDPLSHYAPAEWTCESQFYDAMDGCDCNCGAYDPDCDLLLPHSTLMNCDGGANPLCTASGTCKYSDAPSEWNCEPQHYNSGDGCDCGCGAYDPDCDFLQEKEQIIKTKCVDGIAIGCGSEGECIYAPSIPEEWTCDPKWYATADGCDCNCGSFDLDCKDKNQEVMNCPDLDMTCSKIGECKYNF